MPNNTLSKYTTSFGLSLALGSVVNALLVIAKEKSPSVQAAMQRLTGNHWITHVIIVLAVFVGIGLLLANVNGGHGVTSSVRSLIKTIIGSVVVTGLIIVGFYMMAG